MMRLRVLSLAVVILMLPAVGGAAVLARPVITGAAGWSTRPCRSSRPYRSTCSRAPVKRICYRGVAEARCRAPRAGARLR
jgi:hypothetical protein